MKTRAAVLRLGVIAFLAGSPAAAAERLCDTSFEQCRTPLLSLIRAERMGIDVAFWFMEDDRYVTALIDRWRAGVPVRVVMDTEANVNYPLNAYALQRLRDAGIPMREKTAGGIVHWKTMLFAGQNVVEFSGANFSPHAFVPVVPYEDYIDEVIYFCDDPAVVNSFKTRYDDVWTMTSGYTNHANVTSLHRHYPTFPQDPELNFPPSQNFATRSVAAYTAERVAIDSIIMRITDRRHTDALIAAKQRGVRVRLITEPSQYRDPVRLWHSWNVDRMYMAGIPIRVRKHLGHNHEKMTLLRGQRMTVFGSSNWTSPSASSQLEHNYFTRKSWFFEWFTAQFERKWSNSTGHEETQPFVPRPPTRPAYVAPAAGATAVSLTGLRLRWNPGYWAHKADIYFGTSPSPPLYAANVTVTPAATASVALPEVAPRTTYYWKVVSKTMANLAASGAVRSFTTQ
jgi:phosphatidylserine/phosphatidylglycerophosphate/cardiolipin synthase-like enzyme